MNWYLIQFKPKRHFLASTNLKKQGYEVFLPLSKKTSRKNGKFSTEAAPLFQGYFFLGSISINPNWTSINATRGVSRAVTFDGSYRPLPNQIIESLKQRCDLEGVFHERKKIKNGDRVIIEKGPLANFIAEVEYTDSTKRAWVLIDMIGRKLRARLSVENIKKN